MKKTEAIDIVQNVVEPPTENSPLVSSSPLRFINITPYPERIRDVSDIFINEPSDDDVSFPFGGNFIDKKSLEPYSKNNNEDLTITINKASSPYFSCDMAKRLAIDTVIATGTGIAMMPIFNHLVKNSEKFGIDIHSNKIIFNLSTANTFLVASFSSFVTMNEFIKKHQATKLESDTWIVNLSKTCASFSLILPLGLLWVTEVNNQKVANSSGFDEYMAWATFSTLPLVASQIVDSLSNVNKLLTITAQNNKGSLSAGGQILTYGLAATSLVGRSIAFTEVCKSLALASGVDEKIALGLGIAAGGVLTSLGVSILEHNTIKILFETPRSEFTAKKLIAGGLALTEGLWFTLPLISIGLDATSNWNPLLKGALFIPLVASHTVLESTRIYDNISTFCDYVSDGFLTLKDWCYGNDDMQLAGDNGDFLS
jgi:hypothetical protein